MTFIKEHEKFLPGLDVISYDEFIKYKSEAEWKTAGKFRLEGKEYIDNDGDIITFWFNV